MPVSPAAVVDQVREGAQAIYLNVGDAVTAELLNAIAGAVVMHNDPDL